MRRRSLEPVAGASGLLLLVVLLSWPRVPAAAQDVRVRGRGELELDARLDRALADDYLLVTADTVISRGDDARRTILVLNAMLAVEGEVAGDIVAVDANVFLRPRSRVRGDVVNLGGGLYRSELATIDGEIIDRPLADYTALGVGDHWLIWRRAARSGPIVFDGPFGVELPTYDRVNGVRLGWGAGYRLPFGRALRPEVHAGVRYFSERGAWGGRGELLLRLDTATVHVGYDRDALTNERWIKSDLMNSAVHLLKGKDYRDYYDAERWYVGIDWPLRLRGIAVTATAALRHERARTLRADEPWSILKPDSLRPNLPAGGDINSVLLGGAGEWEGVSSRLQMSVGGELGLDAPVPSGCVLPGDSCTPQALPERSYGLLSVDLDYAANTFRDHSLLVEAHVQAPVGGGTLPLQRWSFVGGSGTLWTFEMAEFRGDRILFADTRYRIPLPLIVPVLGRLELDLRHAAGMAWAEGVSRDIEQNIGLELRGLAVYARIVTNPASFSDDVELSVGLFNPIGANFPWASRAPQPEPQPQP
ncbi:MAG: hypothetical protein ACRELD_00120 [Longimicrobiales bacterium]